MNVEYNFKSMLTPVKANTGGKALKVDVDIIAKVNIAME